MQTILRLLLGLVVFCAVASAQPAMPHSDAQDIVDLLAQKKIEVKARGAGIESVGLELRRLGNQELPVRIAVGTFFVAQQASAQNMVTTEAKTVVLRNSGWVPVSVAAA